MRKPHYFDLREWDYIPSIHTLHAEYPEYSVEELTRMKNIIRMSLIARGEKIWHGYPDKKSILPKAEDLNNLRKKIWQAKHEITQQSTPEELHLA